MRSEKYAANKLSVLLNEIPASDQLPEPDIAEPTSSASPASDPNASASNSSTGPRTIAGKKRSSINATRHGLSGRIVVLPTEDMSLYMQHSKRLVDSLHPATPVEEELAQTVADGYWRMKRFRTVEEGMFAWGNYEEAGEFDAENENIHSAFTAAKAFRANSQAFVNLSIYEQRIQRGIEKASKQLEELQEQRKFHYQRELDRAIRMRDYHEMLQTKDTATNMATNTATNTATVETDPSPAKSNNVVEIKPVPYNPTDDQFVCSGAEIDIESLRRDRRLEAFRASQVGFDYKEYLKSAA
jgi:hypothetical protein